MIAVVELLVAAGANPAEAARAAVVLDRGGSIAEARQAMEAALQERAQPGDLAGELEQPGYVVDDLVHVLDSAVRAIAQRAGAPA